MREFIGKDLLRSVLNNSHFLKSSVNFARSKYKSVKAQVNEMGEFVIFSPYLCFQMNGQVLADATLRQRRHVPPLD